jgi:glycosyltransferase involved in cell wall biosynthesis
MIAETKTTEPAPRLPLLSICIPTYNRAHLLRVALETLLPQVRECGDLVEVWISDNASSDNTAEVVEGARALGPLHYSRNASNLGFHGNTVKLTTELARGGYVWVLGDDDLLMPGMVGRILNTIQANQGMEAFYLNYGIAQYPEDWPANSVGGYTGKLRKLHLDSEQDHIVRQWKELIHHETDLCTELFAQIVRRAIWVDYWSRHSVDPPAGDTMRAVYPHSVMWAETIMNKPCYYMGQAASVCFYGSQWYTESFRDIIVFHYVRLLRFYHQMGLAGTQLRKCERGVLSFCESPLRHLLADRSRPALGTLVRFMAGGWPYGRAWIVAAKAVRGADRPWVISMLLGCLGKGNKLFRLFDPWKPRPGQPTPGQVRQDMTYPSKPGRTELPREISPNPHPSLAAETTSTA